MLPAEAGLEERAISFTKGCYPGQEPVARLHYRGHPNRGLRVLGLEGDALPAYDAERSFAPAFFRFLAGASVPDAVVRNFTVVEPHEAKAAFRRARGHGTVYVSPLVEKTLDGTIPDGFQRLAVPRHVSSASIDRLRVRLALDLAIR